MAQPLLSLLAASCAASGLLARLAPDYSFGIVTTTLVIFPALAVLRLVYVALLYQRFFSPIRHIPDAGDKHWLLGQTSTIIKEPSGAPMKRWFSTVKNEGLIRYSFMMTERLAVASPSALSEVLVTKAYDFIKPSQLRHGLGRITGIGLLLAEGDEHKAQRRSLQPAFAFRHVKNIYPVFWEKSRLLTDCLRKASEEEPRDTSEKHRPGAINVETWSSKATLDIIGLTGMGKEFHSLTETNRVNQTYQGIFESPRPGILAVIMGLMLPFWLLVKLPFPRNRKINEGAKYIKQVCRDLIAKRREAIEVGKGSSQVDIISVALESGSFSDEELVHQAMLFLVAGHETTSSAMIWAIYEMCRNPDVQSRLRDEIRAKIPSLESEITAAQIDDCQYLQAVCNEVLRLWSPVGITMRITARDTTIAGQFIPKGTQFSIVPAATNTSVELWGKDAGEFNPERWLNADGKANAHGGADSNFAFLTFLHGPRSCIGQRFALGEFACLLAAWVGRFETTFEEGSAMAKGEPFDIASGVTSKPKGGVWVTLKEIPGW